MKTAERSFESRRRQWLAAVHRRIMKYRARVRFYSQQLELFASADSPDHIATKVDGYVTLFPGEHLRRAGYEVRLTEGGAEFRKPTGQVFTLPPGFTPKGMS